MKTSKNFFFITEFCCCCLILSLSPDTVTVIWHYCWLNTLSDDSDIVKWHWLCCCCMTHYYKHDYQQQQIFGRPGGRNNRLTELSFFSPSIWLWNSTTTISWRLCSFNRGTGREEGDMHVLGCVHDKEQFNFHWTANPETLEVMRIQEIVYLGV